MTIAFWCVLVAALLPYVPFGFAAKHLNPRAMREGVDKLAGLPQRASGAHLTAFETFPPFAAAVIVSHSVEGASATVDGLAVLYILVRLGHIGFYLADRQPLRSAMFGLGMLLMIAIFVHPALR